VGGAALAALVAAPSGGAGAATRAASAGTLGGRIVFRDAAREVRAEEVERLRWGHIAVELRRGWDTFSVRPDSSGMFVLAGPPGTYRIEYIRIGQLAEFFAPHDVEVRPGKLTCMGTLEVLVGNVAQDVGNNAATSSLSVRDDCAIIGPELQRLGAGSGSAAASPPMTALARPVPAPSFTPTVLEVLVGLRAEASLTSGAQEVAALRASLVVPLSADRGKGNWIASASAVHVSGEFVDARWPAVSGVPSAPARSVWGGALGAGYNVWLLEFQAFGGYLANPGRGGHGALFGGSVRYGSSILGFGLRMDAYPTQGEQVGSFTIDLSPIGVLGSLL
jgi:hypothetical protein